MSNIVRWLHISDYHYDQVDNAEWYTMLSTMTFSNPIDFVLFSGDLHDFRYGTSDYEDSLSFLKCIKKKLKIPYADFFFVPGNHDVNQSNLPNKTLAETTKRRRRTAAKTRRKFIEALKIKNSASDTVDEKGIPLTEYFSDYNAAIQSFLKNACPSCPSGVFVRVWKKKINIIHINTALISYEITGATQMFDITALSKLELANPNLPSIVLAHHNFGRLPENQKILAKQQFKRLHVKAYFHGDTHLQFEDKIFLDDSESIPCFSASSIYRTPNDNWSKTGFYIYEWDTTSPQGIVSVNSYIWRNFNWEKVKTALTTFPLLTARQGLWELFYKKGTDLDRSILPSITYFSEDTPGLSERYDNIMPPHDPPPLMKLIQNHLQDQYFQLVGKGKQRGGGNGKTSTLLNLAAYLTNPKIHCARLHDGTCLIPLYVALKEIYQRRSKNNDKENVISRYIEKTYSISAERNTRYLLLLDGLNELDLADQSKCLSDILEIIETIFTTAVIVLSSRESISSNFPNLNSSNLNSPQRETGMNKSSFRKLSHYFRNCCVEALSATQQEYYIRDVLPPVNDPIYPILDTPFYLVQYKDVHTSISEEAIQRWITPSFAKVLSNRHHYEEAASENAQKVILMLQRLLYELQKTDTDIDMEAVYMQEFLITKVFPYLGYRMVLGSRLSSHLSGKDVLLLDKKGLYYCTLYVLEAYVPYLHLWQEYQEDDIDDVKDWFEGRLGKLKELCNGEKGPHVQDLEKVIPYSAYNSGVLIRPSSRAPHQFCHENYQDFFASMHIAHVVYLLVNGAEPTSDPYFIQLEVIDNVILRDAEEILHLYYGIDLFHQEESRQPTEVLDKVSAKPGRLILSQILARFCESKILFFTRRGIHSIQRLKRLRHYYLAEFKSLFESLACNQNIVESYKSFYSYALCLLARDCRKGEGAEKDYYSSEEYARAALLSERKYAVSKADGYLEIALTLNAIMEDHLNSSANVHIAGKDIRKEDFSFACDVRQCVRQYQIDNQKQPVLMFLEKYLPSACSPNDLIWDCFYIFEEILELSYQKYMDAEEEQYKYITELGFVSKAFLVFAAMGTSGGALNLLGQMVLNQANDAECDPRLVYFQNHSSIAPPQPIPYTIPYVKAFYLFQAACGILRGRQPYSHLKTAELILKGWVRLKDSQAFAVPSSKRFQTDYSQEEKQWIETALTIAVAGDQPMAYYWQGRYNLYLSQEEKNSEQKTFYQKKAIQLFEATQALQYSYVEQDGTTFPSPILLAAIELLSFPQESFKAGVSSVHKAVLMALEKQVDTILQSNYILSNEKYALTKQDVQDNLMRYRVAASQYSFPARQKVDDLLHRLD